MHLSLGAHVLFIGPERFNLDAGATAKKYLSTYIYVCILKNRKFIFFGWMHNAMSCYLRLYFNQPTFGEGGSEIAYLQSFWSLTENKWPMTVCSEIVIY